MEDEKGSKKTDFLYGLAITLATIVVGLISYIFYSSNFLILEKPERCEYNGWAYADKETFDSIDGCNTCFCHSGEVICTELECTEELNSEDSL